MTAVADDNTGPLLAICSLVTQGRGISCSGMAFDSRASGKSEFNNLVTTASGATVGTGSLAIENSLHLVDTR
eukprot:1053950-Amphidinium_carterae.1